MLAILCSKRKQKSLRLLFQNRAIDMPTTVALRISVDFSDKSDISLRVTQVQR